MRNYPLKKLFKKEKVEGLTYLRNLNHNLQFYGFHDVKINPESIVFYYSFSRAKSLLSIDFNNISRYVIRLCQEYHIDLIPKISFVQKSV